MERLNRYYVIQYYKDGWRNFEETEYTEQEIDTELDRLKSLKSGHRFRKLFVRAQAEEVLTASNNPTL